MVFFAYVWLLWAGKAVLARRYRPSHADTGGRPSTVIVPVYNESADLFRACLESIASNRPTELIAVVDGGDRDLASIASEYCDRVLELPKAGKRAAIAAGLAAAQPGTDVVLLVDSDTAWTARVLLELLRWSDAPLVGGVPRRQAIIAPAATPSRRLADWIEDLRYH